MSAIVRTEGLVKRYDRTLAVAGVDLAIDEGEIFGLVGPERRRQDDDAADARDAAPAVGRRRPRSPAGRVTRNPDEVRRVLGFMPDAFGVYDDMKVWEYLDFFARCYGLPAGRPAADDRRPARAGRPRRASATPTSRPSRAGMQQRLCLAHALVHDPQVLLLDEPASGLDPRARVELRELLRELRSMGKTIVISSHILPELEELCTSVAIVDRGQVLAQGRVADIERAAALRGRAAGPAPARGRGARGGPRPVRRRPRRRLGDDPRRTARSSSGSAATTPHPPGCSPSRSAAGLPIVSFARAASDLEELFLQVTSADREPVEAA